MIDDALAAKAAQTREAGCFETEIPENGIPLDALLVFISDMFPGSKNEDLIVLPAGEGKFCVEAVHSYKAN